MTRIVSPDAQPFEAGPHDKALRPQTLAEFVGQAQAKGNLKVFIEAAKARGECDVAVQWLLACVDHDAGAQNVLTADKTATCNLI